MFLLAEAPLEETHGWSRQICPLALGYAVKLDGSLLRLVLGTTRGSLIRSPVPNLVVVSPLLFKVGEGEVEQLAGGQRAVGAPVVQRRRLLQEHLARVDILCGKVKSLLSPQYFVNFKENHLSRA